MKVYNCDIMNYVKLCTKVNFTTQPPPFNKENLTGEDFPFRPRNKNKQELTLVVQENAIKTN